MCIRDRKDYGAVRRNAYDGFRLNLLFSLCMGLPVFLLRHQIGGWFNDNVEVQEMCIRDRCVAS